MHYETYVSSAGHLDFPVGGGLGPRSGHQQQAPANARLSLRVQEDQLLSKHRHHRHCLASVCQVVPVPPLKGRLHVVSSAAG